jgi:hypothetical protein
MSQATGGTRFAQRWRAVYDVAIGVVLFVSLLLPALQQAGTGTLAGLRNGMILLLLDMVVLVMLSRYVTSPARTARRERATAPPVSQEVFSSDRTSELLDDSGAPRDVTGLTFSDVGITVHQVGSPSPSNLAWADCAAVVYSQVAIRNGTRFTYLQFVALHEGRIRRGTRDKRSRGLATMLGLTESAAAMVWVVSPQLLRLPPLVLAYVEQHHPHVRVVRPDVIDHADQ